ncbi:MAG: c-type cytochrome biogenesis protein CcsB [Gammaproteobacteria bacterium]|nr:c-type cytochrome biogenesis protein CcsB [Gammaproteobacteria bacterium]
MAVTRDRVVDDLRRQAFLRALDVFDWLWAAVLAGALTYTYITYWGLMDTYEVGILGAASLVLTVMGWNWKLLRALVIVVAALSLCSITLYGTSLTNGEERFLLKYLLSSQSATLWMSSLYVMATLVYFGSFLTNSDFAGRVATAMTWSAIAMGLVGLMVRWRESYLISVDIGHIPISNLYEVFILFCIITSLVYLYYEAKFRTRAMGGFVLLVVSSAVAFLLWYTFDRGANEIQPLVPALQSYWMKIHVPANFIGYGCFSLAAMIGVTYLLRTLGEKVRPDGIIATRLPPLTLLDEVMYKAIALGFAFFTIATILGSLWAAEAWGGYWSWDPKETWALIVWLNYAAWLHMRIAKGWRGTPMAWWAVVGLFVTLFAFLGVNMFLSGLHSYGEL